MATPAMMDTAITGSQRDSSMITKSRPPLPRNSGLAPSKSVSDAR